MNFENLLRVFLERPVYQRLFLAFTLGLFISCGARMAGAQPEASEWAQPGGRGQPPTTLPNTGGR